MSLADRCDEIVRLIDETLAELAAPPAIAGEADAVVTPLAPRAPRSTWVEARRGAGALRPDPSDRAAAGF